MDTQIKRMEQVKIYDTTLRDGMQAEGISFSLADKLAIARRLDAFGVHYIAVSYTHLTLPTKRIV